MTFFTHFFGSADSKRRLAHIKALMELAAVDGNVDDSEIDRISEIGLRIGLTDSEIDRIFQEPDSIAFKIPESVEERLILLFDYVHVMYADGVIDPNELDYCYKTVTKLRFPEEKAKLLIDLFSRAVERGDDPSALLVEAKRLLE